jgi:hypothetical protein
MAKAKARRAATPARALASVRASLARAQTRGERVVARLRQDAEAFMTRTRGEVLKEMRAFERRLLHAVHAATEERVARLERRIAKLEAAVPRPAGTGGEQAGDHKRRQRELRPAVPSVIQSWQAKHSFFRSPRRRGT